MNDITDSYKLLHIKLWSEAKQSLMAGKVFNVSAELYGFFVSLRMTKMV